MAYYDGDNASSWASQQTLRQGSSATTAWEHQAPSRASALSPAHVPDAHAFAAQFEEIERATDNLMKSGKWFPGQQGPALQQQHHQPGSMAMGGSGGGMRRESAAPSSAAAIGRGFDYGVSNDARGGPTSQQPFPPSGRPQQQQLLQHHHQQQHQPQQQHQQLALAELDGRPGSSGLHGYYQGQRFPGNAGAGASAGPGAGRGQHQSEAEQMLQAKRRMAAQRERELRNYHQEQQYHRISGSKSERSLSPNTQQQTDENHRDLITRQHRALYGESSSLYGIGPETGSSNAASRASSQVHSGGRGPSPLSFEPFGASSADASGSGVQGRDSLDGGVATVGSGAGSSLTSPTSAQQSTFSPLEQPQQQSQASRTSNSSPGTSPPLVQGSGKSGGVAPIGTRPSISGPSAGNKRSTTPLTPSALSHGFSVDSDSERAAAIGAASSAAALPSLSATAGATEKAAPGLGAWGSAPGGVWGAAAGKPSLAVQPSVWG